MWAYATPEVSSRPCALVVVSWQVGFAQLALKIGWIVDANDTAGTIVVADAVAVFTSWFPAASKARTVQDQVPAGTGCERTLVTPPICATTVVRFVDA